MSINCKLLIGLFLLFVLFTPFLCSAYAEPSAVDRIVFIHRRARGGASVGANPTDQATDYKYTGIHWVNLPVTYEVNPSSSGVDTRVAVAAIQSAFETWDSSTNKELFNDNVQTTTRRGSSARDEHNVVSWALMSDSNTIAITYIWYYPQTKEIVECDTIFNMRFSWSLDLPGDKMSVQNIATHEAGHWIMLGDLYTYKASLLTMYGYSKEGEIIKESLGVGDVLGLQKAYGP